MPLFMLQLFVCRTAPHVTKIKLAEGSHPPLREWKCTLGFRKLLVFLEPLGKYQLAIEDLYMHFVSVGADICLQ